ncbi:hypothetical protein DY000_02002668 [Brassica cretica]|uniref:Uncharacterized protein n=1 Tax=Brassica cretica TaxID=69181 RepID=A0ABQ7CGM0_BRACR|nr:hypothetical protein DY000_02002668 [Brassica cretica]
MGEQFSGTKSSNPVFQSNRYLTPPWPPPFKMVLFYEPFIGILYLSTTNPSSLDKLFGLITYGRMGWTVRPKSQGLRKNCLRLLCFGLSSCHYKKTAVF